MNPLFVLDDSLFRTLDWDDVKATREGLVTMDAFTLPAPTIDLRWRPYALENAPFLKPTAGGIASSWDESEWLLARGIELRRESREAARMAFETHSDDASRRDLPTFLFKISYDFLENEDGRQFPFTGTTAQKLEILMGLTTILIVSLATVGAEKVVLTRPPGRLTSHGTPKHTHVTTIRVPMTRYVSGARGAPTGREVRTHFRRGHYTRQPYGPGRSLRKEIWIPPMFVKADPDYVPPRPPEYRVTA